jgi:UDP-N-acetylmuramoyl-tripeptide--D-alanyl-D-alanine ligase
MEGLVKKGISLNTHQMVSATGGILLKDGGQTCLGVSIDTRTLEPGALYFALQGERFDGHSFVKEAVDKGAHGVVIQTDRFYSMGEWLSQIRGFVIGVNDTLRGLQDLASAHRRQFDLPLVAVTGSNGKSTTKELIASILQGRWHVLKNVGNLNNHIGVPLTLLKLDPSHQAAVSEMGISGRGELTRLCEMAQPELGVITNIGPAHLQALGSLEGVAQAKGELLEALKSGSLFAHNLNDPYITGLVMKTRGIKIISFGLDRVADVSGQAMGFDPQRGEIFRLKTREGEVSVSLPLFGHHHILNALAASAVAIGLGFSLDEIKRGLEGFSGMKMRMEVHPTPAGIWVINDAYNANPDSMKYALETLVRLKGPGRGIAVLGDMLELGAESEDLHLQLGRATGRQGLDFLFTVGEQGRLLAKGAVEGGMDSDKVWALDHGVEVTTHLSGLLRAGDWVLVNGSRKMRLEEIVEELLKK